MKYYVDVSQLPIAEAMAALPSFSVGNFASAQPENCPLKIAND